MGNSHGHHGSHKSGESTPTSTSSRNGSKKSMSRKQSEADLQTQEKENEEKKSEKPTTHTLQSTSMLPVERLAKILTEKAQKEEKVNGVTLTIFTRYLFPRYPTFAEKLYNYFLLSSQLTKHNYMSCSVFKQQCERYLAILDDDVIRSTFVKMWSKIDTEKNSETLTPDALTSMLMCAYQVSMDHYSEGPQMCLSISKTLKAVVDSCFHNKVILSSQFVAHWLETNAPRLLLPLHRYAVHSLATSWRTLEANEPPLSTGTSDILFNPGLELTTPVLEQPPPFAQGKMVSHPHLLTMSMSWLLAGALPPLYSRPQKAHSPSSSGTGLSSMSFLSKIVCAIPSHWALLYDSDEMGLGANRFTHHVMNYKGPTLVIIRVQNNQKFCIASPCEWKESHHYWGGEGAAVFQLLPKFQLLEKGSKMLYLNLTVRGYAQGLRAGSDPRAPIISVDAGFEKIEWQKIPYYIETIEVWGCGDQVQRDQQLEVKKWEVKEAERQRTVKLSAADWLDHPDRYLLELAGRPQYHQNQT